MVWFVCVLFVVWMRRLSVLYRFPLGLDDCTCVAPGCAHSFGRDGNHFGRPVRQHQTARAED